MVRVAVGIIRHPTDRRRVLLCRRKRTSRYGLKWEFPGGKIEDGENAEASLRREIREELGIDATVGGCVHRTQCAYSDGGAFDVSFHAVLSYGGEIENRVFEECRWIEVTRLPDYDVHEGNREVIEQLALEYEERVPSKA